MSATRPGKAVTAAARSSLRAASANSRSANAETRALLGWLRERAIPFAAERGPSRHALRSLRPLLAGKRVAFLGESLHFVHEKFVFRLAMLRFLAAEGFTLIGEELSYSDGLRVQDYLVHGDPATLARVTLLGYRGGARTDRDDSMRGLLAGGTRTRTASALQRIAADKTAFAAAQRKFYLALRRLRSSAPALSLFGFDADYGPGDSYGELHSLIAAAASPLLTHLPTHLLTHLGALLQRVHGESMGEEIERLAWALDWLDLQYAPLTDALGSSGYAQLRHLLAQLHDSFSYVRTAWNTDDRTQIAAGMAEREQIMHGNVAYTLSEVWPDTKAVLLGACAHLPKDDTGMPQASDGIGAGGDGRTASLGESLGESLGASLGDFVARTLLPGQVFSIWMLHGGGSDGQTRNPSRQRLRTPATSVNALLAKVGGAFVLPLADLDDARAAPLRAEVELLQMHDTRLRLRLPEQVDAIYFVPKVTAITGVR